MPPARYFSEQTGGWQVRFRKSGFVRRLLSIAHNVDDRICLSPFLPLSLWFDCSPLTLLLEVAVFCSSSLTPRTPKYLLDLLRILQMGCAASTTVTFHDLVPEAHLREHQEDTDASAPERVSGSVSPAMTCSSAEVSTASVDASSRGGNSSTDSIRTLGRNRRRRRCSNTVSASQQQRLLGWLQHCVEGLRPTVSEGVAASETSSDSYGLSASRNYLNSDTDNDSPRRRPSHKIEIDDSSPDQQSVVTSTSRKFSVEYCSGANKVRSSSFVPSDTYF